MGEVELFLDCWEGEGGVDRRCCSCCGERGVLARCCVGESGGVKTGEVLGRCRVGDVDEALGFNP